MSPGESNLEDQFKEMYGPAFRHVRRLRRDVPPPGVVVCFPNGEVEDVYAKPIVEVDNWYVNNNPEKFGLVKK